MAKRGLDQISSDLRQQLLADWNGFIETVSADLATDVNKGGASPAYTGFFASSWKASLTPNDPVDNVKDFQPWANIKKQKDKDPSVSAQIKPRYPVPSFKLENTVFIGSTVEYAAYAFEKPSISNYIQGDLRQLVRQTFRGKKAAFAPSVLKGGQPV